MNNTFIKLQTTKISGLSDMTWHGDEDDVQDLSKIKDWDLSHNNLTDSTLRYLASKTGSRKWEAMETINLSYNRLSPHCFPVLITWTRTFPNAAIDLSYNSMNKTDFETLPTDVRQRVIATYAYDLELFAMKGDLKKTQENLMSVQNWQSIEDNVLEDQVTRFVQKYFEDKGYTAENLGSNKIYERDGRVCLELDGLIIAESDTAAPQLVTVETKHSLRQKHIDDRRKKLTKFINFLNSIPDDDDKNAPAKYRGSCGQLRPYKDWSLDHYIGGVNVPESVKSYAQKQGFHVLQYRGDRFDIANSKSAFVPEE